MPKYFHYRADDLRSHITRTFTALQVPSEEAKVAAEVIISADLRGVDSHGIIRLHSYYCDRLRKGWINAKSPVQVISETITTLALDGGNGLGQVVSHHAMQRCIQKAQASGVAMVTMRSSNHYGIAGYYAMMALPHNMIGISFTNSQPLVAPTYGRKAMLGTNPIAVAVPAGKERPYVLDMATSIVPIGRITVYEKAGKDIPVGWGIDQTGRVTENPTEVLQGGALMPLGGIDLMRGYKGYGLGLLVDIFCGVLAGGQIFGEDVDPHTERPAGTSHFFAAVHIDAFRPVEQFNADMDGLIQQLKQSPKAVDQQRIFIHGEKEFEKAERYAREGIPLLEKVVAELKQKGAEIDVPFDCPLIKEESVE